MDRVRAWRVVWVCLWTALVSGVAAGAYWGWWNAREKQAFVDSNPAAPWVVGAVVCGLALVVALVLGLVLLVTPERDG